MSLDGVISAAVDHAVTTTSAPASPDASAGDASATPHAPQSEPTPSDGTAAVSGSETAAALSPGSTDAPTTRATDRAATPESPIAEPPAAKWKQVLENARTKERTTARSEIFQTYGLADELDPVEVRAHLDLLRRDPQLHAELTLQALKRDGTYRPRGNESTDEMISAAQPRPVSLPDPGLTSVDGQRAYTAEQVIDVVNLALNQFRNEMSGELQPLRDLHQETRVAKIRADAQQYAGEAVREASQWHRFNELTPRIREIMVGDKRTTLLSAYNRALQEDLHTSTTQLKTETRKQTLDEIRQASAANTVRPGVAATARSGRAPVRGGLDARLDRAISAALSSTTVAR